MSTQPNILDADRITTYAPNNSAGPFDVGFPIFDITGADLVVELNGVEQVGNWTIAVTPFPGFYGAPNTYTGAISFDSPVAGTLIIEGGRAPRRITQYAEGRGVPARDHNTEYNILTSIARELWQRLKRTVMVPRGETGFVLPSAATRANRALGFDSSGAPAMLVPGSLPFPLVRDEHVDPNAAVDATKLRFKEAGTGSVPRSVALIFKDKPIPITAYGAEKGGPSCSAALIYSLQAGEAENRFVEVPPGYWVFHSGVAYANGCPGIIGHGRASVLVPQFLDAPLLTITVPPETSVTRKVFEKFGVQGSFAAESAYDASRFLKVVGGGPGGFSRNRINNLIIEGVHTAIEIDTNPIATSFGAESQSGWNMFQDLEFWGGARPLYYGIKWTRGSSTGNAYSNLQGAPTTSMLRFEGNGCVVGDIVYVGGHLGAGYLAHFANNIVYNRSQQYIGMQVDASSLGPFLFDSGQVTPPNNIKVSGTIGGANTWGATPPLRFSSIDDLGGGRWQAGGKLAGAGVAATSGAQQVDLWSVELGVNTMTTVTVAVDGIVGGVDAGGCRRTFTVARLNGNVVIAPGPETQQTVLGAPSPSFVTLSAVASGANAVFRVVFTPNGQSSQLHTNIYVEGGAVRVLRAPTVEL